MLSALTVCLKSKPFSAVSFTDLQKISGVGRSTIYRLFDSTADILAYGCDMFAQKVNDRYKDFTVGENPDRRDIALFVFESLTNEYELLDAIMESKREDILVRSMLRFKQYITESDADVTTKYHREIAAAAIGAILKVWLSNGRKETPEELLNIMESIVRG
ncbi:MAG: TetR/AcrR family transcriptional regulator [Bacteroidia bacterium]|nr:TetR/AcrR family transcriptional regulator [Bacteroidia bacterium]